MAVDVFTGGSDFNPSLVGVGHHYRTALPFSEFHVLLPIDEAIEIR